MAGASDFPENLYTCKFKYASYGLWGYGHVFAMPQEEDTSKETCEIRFLRRHVLTFRHHQFVESLSQGKMLSKFSVGILPELILIRYVCI